MPMSMILVLGILVLSTRVSSFSLVIGPARPARPDGIWPNNIPLDGTADSSAPFRVAPLSEDFLLCDKIKIPQTHPVLGGGLAIYEVGVFVNTSGVKMKIGLYTHDVSGRPNKLLEERNFTSVIGRNDISLEQRWSFPVNVGGVSAAWVCVMHGAVLSASRIDFYLATANSVTGPFVNWFFENPSLPTNLSSFPSSAPLPTLANNLNVWIVGESLATTPTNTPIPTQTVTATATRTTSFTATQPNTETSTSTRSRTPTATRTQTISSTPSTVPTDDPGRYIYVGLPAAGEFITPPWIDFHPKTSRVGELVEVRVYGFHTFTSEKVLLKLGRGVGYDDCFQTAPGAEVQTLEENRVFFRANKADTYAVCIKYRQDWEKVERRFTVLDADLSASLHGYASCSEMISFNSSLCGCFLGTSGVHVQLPVTFPLHLLQTSERLHRVVNVGCCTDSSNLRHFTGLDWGFCANGALPKGYLNNV
eukprot:NODE_369_length_2348_cov_122.709874_g344_i0.p1 GENE.NODE_369_length_2348_cov_122.709874_g344_i0~~NODE_369_length_2348_cov_122.709874_g344_i0.p1  ORF type:complete len:477 (+),score=44.87 NODE_369_length_2348_cov_122.709874_g344_i0:814-2244(+)